eukprot:SAG22_NODE_2937_length_2092_cov_1.322629_4_plen_93_part_00
MPTYVLAGRSGEQGFKPGDVLPPAVVKNLRRGYYAAVSHMDDQIGAAMHALEQTGYADNTVVSFWGDVSHGGHCRCCAFLPHSAPPPLTHAD